MGRIYRYKVNWLDMIQEDVRSQGVEHTCVAHAVAQTVEAALAYNYGVRPRVSVRDLALNVGTPYIFEVEPHTRQDNGSSSSCEDIEMTASVLAYRSGGESRPVDCFQFISEHGIMLEKFWRLEEGTLIEQDWGPKNKKLLMHTHANTRPERRGVKVVIHGFKWFTEKIPVAPGIPMSDRMRVPRINVNQRAIEMEMMKALETHPAIVLIISIDQRFRNYKHGVYVPSLDEPCDAQTHAVTLLGWGTYEEKITGFGLKKRKRDEAPNVGEFWCISNPWGSDWGMNGLGYIVKGMTLPYIHHIAFPTFDKERKVYVTADDNVTSHQVISEVSQGMEARAGNAYEGARYEAESRSGKLASGDSASRRMETTTTSVVSSLISHYNGLSLGSNKRGGASDTRS